MSDDPTTADAKRVRVIGNCFGRPDPQPVAAGGWFGRPRPDPWKPPPDRADALYRRLLAGIDAHGIDVATRNSRCRRVTGWQCTFDRTPLIAARRTAWRNCLREWEWFMSGSDRIADLHEAVRPWWQPWADPRGRIQNNYSVQFRTSSGAYSHTFDQIAYMIDGIQNHPNSRRLVITTWNTCEMAEPETPITNCHGTVIQAFVDPTDNSLSLVTYQRSADVVCGVPHNWLQYWAFLMWLAHRGGRGVGRLTWVGGDCHVYEAHYPLAEKIMDAAYPADVPQLVYTPTSDDFRADDFALSGPYGPVLTDRAEMIV